MSSSRVSAFLEMPNQEDIAHLLPFLRVLLTTDGTVTKSLEAYFWEPISVVSLAQHYIAEVPFNVETCLGNTQKLLKREVELCGVDSGKVYASAESFIAADRLLPSVREQLEAGQLGIGGLLRDCGLETYREILECGVEPAVSKVWRRYLIHQGHSPIIQITESFPLAIYGM